MFPSIPISDSIHISTYSLTYVVAISIGLYFAYLECKRYNLPLHEFPPVSFWGVLGGIIGAKIFFIIFYRWDSFLQDPLHQILSPGGWMYYGGEIGGIAAGILYLAIKKLPILRPLDIGGMIFMLSHAIGRIGCFLSGCCYGTSCDLPWAVQFPKLPYPVHPTQLYEAVPLFGAFIIIWIFRKKFIVPGTMFSTYLIFDGIQRSFIELYRGDNPYIGFLNWTPSQYIGVLSFITGMILLVVLRKQYSRQL